MHFDAISMATSELQGNKFYFGVLGNRIREGTSKMPLSVSAALGREQKWSSTDSGCTLLVHTSNNLQISQLCFVRSFKRKRGLALMEDFLGG